MVEHQLPKLRARVRFSSPAPCETPRSMTRGFFVVQTGGRLAHDNRTTGVRLTTGGLLVLVRPVGRVVLRPLEAGVGAAGARVGLGDLRTASHALRREHPLCACRRPVERQHVNGLPAATGASAEPRTSTPPNLPHYTPLSTPTRPRRQTAGQSSHCARSAQHSTPQPQSRRGSGCTKGTATPGEHYSERNPAQSPSTRPAHASHGQFAQSSSYRSHTGGASNFQPHATD